MQKFITIFDPKSEWNFVGFIPLATKIGFILPIATLIGLFALGVNWGLDFKGGTEIQVKFDKAVPPAEVRELLVAEGFKKNNVQQYGSDDATELLLRIERITSMTDDNVATIKGALEAEFDALKQGSSLGKDSLKVEFTAKEGDRIFVSLPDPVVAKPVAKNKDATAIDAELTTLLMQADGNKPLDDFALDTMSIKGFDRGAVVAGAQRLNLLVTASTAKRVEPKVDGASAKMRAYEKQIALLTKIIDGKGVKLRRTKNDEGVIGTDDAIKKTGESYRGVVKYLVMFQGISVDIERALAKKYGGAEWEKCLGNAKDKPATCPDIRRIDFVDAQVAEGLQTDGLMSVLMALLLILIYVAIRFDLFFAPGAVIALVHDAIGALAIFAFGRLEFDQPSIAALLTVVGYSINNTIVIYDRIRETMPIDTKSPLTQDEVKSYVNKAINDTFSRTVNTSLTTFMAALALFIFAGGVVQNFASVLMVGIVLGAFSSTCLAPASYLFFRNTFQNEDGPKDTLGPSTEEKLRGVV